MPGIAPAIDATRFALISEILPAAVRELLIASDKDTADKANLIQAAAVVNWMTFQASRTTISFTGLDERVAAIFNGLPKPEQPHVVAAENEMAANPRPPMPSAFVEIHDLSATRDSLQQAEQILGWSSCAAAEALLTHIRTLRRLMSI